MHLIYMRQSQITPRRWFRFISYRSLSTSGLRGKRSNYFRALIRLIISYWYLKGRQDALDLRRLRLKYSRALIQLIILIWRLQGVKMHLIYEGYGQLTAGRSYILDFLNNVLWTLMCILSTYIDNLFQGSCLTGRSDAPGLRIMNSNYSMALI